MSQSPLILYDAAVSPGATKSNGTIVTSNIRYEDGSSSVAIQKFLYVKFKAPGNTRAIDVDVQIQPKQSISPNISVQPDGTTYNVTAKINFVDAYTLKATDTLSWEINGDLTSDSETYTNSFELYADQLPGENY